ncbi:unnamed protein product [Rhizopus microsporus]
MTFSPATPPYDFEHISTNKPFHQTSVAAPDMMIAPSSPPDLHKELPLFCTNQVQNKQHCHRRAKSMPYRSPSINDNNIHKHIVFQLSMNDTIRIIRGHSLLSSIRKQSNQHRISHRPYSKKKLGHVATMIEIPRSIIAYDPSPKSQEKSIENNIQPKSAKRRVVQQQFPIQYLPPPSSGRPCRIKGPCQACQETVDGCMRKAFDWPFETSQTFFDKGKPYVYLCNKCGLRYNKSNGCVCRHCRWVFCKEEKEKRCFI